MAKFLEIVETEDVVQLKLPPRQRISVVLTLTFLTSMCLFGCVWWGWQWLTSAAVLRQGVSEVASILLCSLAVAAGRALLLELSTSRLTFERTTIGVRRTLFGLSLSRRWYLCYRIQEFRITQLARHPDRLRLDAITDKGRFVMLAARLPSDTFTQLVHLIRRKDFAYFREEVSL